MVEVRSLGEQIRQLQSTMDEADKGGAKKPQKQLDADTRADDAWNESVHSAEAGTSSTSSRPNASMSESATLLQRK